MAIRVRISTEFAFLLSGVFIMIVAWALNLVGTLASESSSGHGGMDVYLWVFFIFQGLAFSTVGVIGANYREFLANPTFAKRYLVAFMFIADGGLHLLALNQHLDIPFAAAFFAVVAPIQILVGMLFPSLPRRLDPLWLLFNAFLIGAFILTRMVAIWPIGVVEDADPIGLISKAIEVATIATLVSLIRAKNATPIVRSASTANGP